MIETKRQPEVPNAAPDMYFLDNRHIPEKMNLVASFEKSEVKQRIGDPGTLCTADMYCFESWRVLEMLGQAEELEGSERQELAEAAER